MILSVSASLFRVSTLVVLCLIMLRAAPGAAQDDAAGCIPIDLIVLLDQSNSMEILSDPTGTRITAVHTLIAALYDDAAYRCAGLLHRIGVIAFGSDAEPLIAFSDPAGQIRVTPDEPRAGWRARRDAAIARVIVENRRNAGLRAAIELADAMLLTPTPDPATDDAVMRQRLVILLTDGPPCPDIAVERALPEIQGGLCASTSWVLHYLRADQPFLNDYVGGNASAGGFEFEYGLNDYFLGSAALLGTTQFHVVYFTPQRQLSFVPPLLDEAWADITSRRRGLYFSPARIDGDLDQLAIVLDTIVSPLLNPARELVLFSPDVAGCTGSFVVQPYLDSAMLVTLRRGADGALPRLIPPNPVNPLGVHLLAEGALPDARRYLLDNAPPGVWTIAASDTDCELIDAQVARYPLEIVIESPESVTINRQSPYYAIDESAYVGVTFTNAFGSPMRVRADHPIAGCASFNATLPSAQTAIAALPCFTLRTVSDGVLRSDAGLPAPGAADYFYRYESTFTSVDPRDAGASLPLVVIDRSYSVID